MATFLMEKYDYILNDLADPRVKDWFLIATPYPTLAVVTLYLLAVYIFLPSFMKHRKAYSLKTFIQWYNVFQIISCTVMIWGVATSGWTTYYSFGCQPVDYSDNYLAVRMLKFCFLLYLLKGVELIETALFILRKKYNQVSKLHVYHHSSTFILTWLGVKFVGGGMATFPIMVNSFIHIMMYTYYLLASFGPTWQRRIVGWKPALTMMQMVQFCILIAHSLQSLHPDCHVPKQLLLIYIPNVLLVFKMFWDFYRENYMKKVK